MGLDDKAEELKGKAKEAWGDATDDPQMEAEGKVDQVKGKAGQLADDVKDTFD